MLAAIARETPFTVHLDDPARPKAAAEPVLNVGNIQGNVLAGFNKDHQTLVFLKVTNQNNFRAWLGRLIPFVATTSEVLAFNRLFKEIRSRRGLETGAVQATWINVALSFDVLRSLTGDGAALEAAAKSFPDYSEFANRKFLTADAFKDEAFRNGMQSRSIDKLDDPLDNTGSETAGEGNRNNWLFGGPGNEADVVVILAGDSAAQLSEEVVRLEDTIYSGRTGSGEFAPSGVTIVYKQHGATLPPPLTGHEHFGFLDGVSQPGIRGRVSADHADLLTLRQNPDDLNQGKPGQDLLWPGEFVFGYPEQDPNLAVDQPGPDSLNSKPWKNNKRTNDAPQTGPVWARDGSYYVVRRLRQDVSRFHAFLEDTARTLGVPSALVGAKLVGRWASGAPILRADKHDNPDLADDDCANNHFEFQSPSAAIKPQNQQGSLCVDQRKPQSAGDKAGSKCPFGGHIRKAYPRDDVGTFSPDTGENTTQTHRLLRRGIPFGNPFVPPTKPDQSDSGNRGLVFAAYQTSIVEQFEFVQHSWANNAEFKDKPQGGKLVSGHDPIIGQTNSGSGGGPNGNRERRVVLTVEVDGNAKTQELVLPADWVIPTGGGYFFSPSIDALYLLTGTTRPRRLR